MGFVLAVSVFAYPLALPLATLAALFFAAASLERGLAVAVARGVVILPVLSILLGPGTVSTGAGSFLLPWWLHFMAGHTGVRYYVLQYTLGCIALFIVLLAAVRVWRRIARRTNET